MHVIADLTAYVPAGGGVSPVSPGRLLDSRATGVTVDGQFQGQGAVAGQSEVALQVTGRHGVPGDALAVMLNVTATGGEAAGFLTVYPCGESRPLASSVNYVVGQTVPNEVLAKVGAGGKVCIWSRSTVHVIADLTAYVPAPTTTPGPDPDPDPDPPTGPETPTNPGELPPTPVGPCTNCPPDTDPPDAPVGGGAIDPESVYDWGFTDQVLAVKNTTTLAIAYSTGFQIYYGECSANCAQRSSWGMLQIASSSGAITLAGMDIDDFGVTHVMIGGIALTSGFSAVYGRCAANCLNGANWQSRDLSSLPAMSHNTGFVTIEGRPRPGTFTVNWNTGRVGFFVGEDHMIDAALDFPPRYVYCDSNCTNLASWSGGNVLNTQWQVLEARADQTVGTNQTLLMLQLDESNPTTITYAYCGDAVKHCNDMTSWRFLTGDGLNNGWNNGVQNLAGWQSTVKLDSFGAAKDLGMAQDYTTGRVYFGLPDQNDYLAVLSCANATACVNYTNWTVSSLTNGALGEGINGVDVFAASGIVDVVSTNGGQINFRECASNCWQQASWTSALGAVVDTNDATTQDILPSNSNTDCPGSYQPGDAWWPLAPVVAPVGSERVVVHSAYAIYKCPGQSSPASGYSIGRISSTL